MKNRKGWLQNSSIMNCQNLDYDYTNHASATIIVHPLLSSCSLKTQIQTSEKQLIYSNTESPCMITQNQVTLVPARKLGYSITPNCMSKYAKIRS